MRTYTIMFETFPTQVVGPMIWLSWQAAHIGYSKYRDVSTYDTYRNRYFTYINRFNPVSNSL